MARRLKITQTASAKTETMHLHGTAQEHQTIRCGMPEDQQARNYKLHGRQDAARAGQTILASLHVR